MKDNKVRHKNSSNYTNNNINENSNNIDYIYLSQENDEKEKYDLNNIYLFKYITDNECIDMNEDLLNKQKQLKELEKQIKKTTKKSKFNNIIINKNPKTNYNYIKDNYILCNDINTLSHDSEKIEQNKIEELNYIIKEPNEEICINPDILNTVNFEINNNQDKNLINKLLNNNNNKQNNNHIRYEKESISIEEDKNNIFSPCNNYNYTNNGMIDIYCYKKQNINYNLKSNHKNNKNNNEKQNINIMNENIKDNNNNNINSKKSKDEDIELIYLKRLSDLQKENNNHLIENKKLREDIVELDKELKMTKKELKEKIDLYDKIKFEYDLLNQKYENILNNQNKIISEKEKQMQDEIERLKSVIDNLNVEIKTKEDKLKNDINQLKQMLDNFKIIHEQLKDQYDLVMLKMNTVNQENYTLKRELYFYQNNTNNN